MTLIVLGSWFLVGPVNSQAGPELIISWRASTFAPSNYQGKILPTRDSLLNVRFNLIDKGRVVDLSKTKIQWKNGADVATGVGLKSRDFKISKLDTDNFILTIIVINYGGRNIEKTISIPVAKPEVMIERIGTNSFIAQPYFFNVTDLKELGFEWSANGEKPSGSPENPNILTIENIDTSAKISLGLELNLEINVAKILNKAERAFGRLTIKL